MVASSAATYFNYSTSRYEITIPIQAVEAGDNGNAIIDAINQMHTTIVDLDGVTNKNAITGGKDEESDSDFRERILLALTGSVMGTIDGYNSLLYSQEVVIDVKTISSGDPLMVRDDGEGGCVDIWVKHGGTTEPHHLTFNYNASAPNTEIFEFQPVTSISLVEATNFGILTKDWHYRLVRDTGGNGYSHQGEDSIQMIDRGDIANGEQITVTYNWNRTIYDLQQIVESDQYKIITADVLIKQGIEKIVDIGCQIRIFSGHNFSTVSDDIKTAITNYINAFKLGDDAKQGDIIHTIYSADGVDDVIVPLTKLCLSGASGVGDILCEDNEFVSIGTITVEEVT